MGDRFPRASVGVNADFFSIFVQTLKGNDPVNLGKDRVVFSQTHIVPGMYLGASLANKDIPGQYLLACVPLHPKSLAGTISPVPGAAARLLMCHYFLPLFPNTLKLLCDIFNPDKRKVLPVSFFPAIALPPSVLEDHDLSVFALAGDTADHLGIFKEGLPHLNLFTV